MLPDMFCIDMITENSSTVPIVEVAVCEILLSVFFFLINTMCTIITVCVVVIVFRINVVYTVVIVFTINTLHMVVIIVY